MSALCLLLQFIRRTWKIRRKNGYTSLNSTSHGPKDADEEVDEEQGDNAAIPSGAAGHTCLDRRKTVSFTSLPVVEISRPRRAKVLVVVEILALLGLIGTHLEAALTHPWRHNRKTASISTVCVWCYILLLTLSRLLPSRLSTYRLPQLWNHTTTLYCLQWLFVTILFRSALIHPSSHLAQALSIADFVLASVLAIIAITTRKGNRVVLLEYEDNLEPSHEPLASLLSLATFSWVDSLVWKGYWKTLEITDVWSLLPSDKAANVLANYRQLKKTSKLAWHLMKHLRSLLLLQQFWAVLSGLFTFAPTLLLRAILRYIERPEDTPAATAWLLVMSLALAGIISGIADNQALWIGRRICIRLRAIMVAEIYTKTLRRKAAATIEADISEEDKKASEKSSTILDLKQRILSLFRKKTAPTTSSGIVGNGVGGKASADTLMNSGAIINLMSVDSFKVSEICAYLHFLFPTVPIQLVVAVILLYQILGWSSIASIGIMFCLSPLNVWISRQFAARQKKIMSAIDGRIHATNEILQNVRIIKYFAWEQRFAQDVNEKRTIELRALRSKFILWALAAAVWHGVPILITASSFFLYTTVEKKPLMPSVAFTALSLFGIIRYPLDKLADMTARILESKVSVDRVEQFLNEEETGKYNQLSLARDTAGEGETIGFDNATFTWAGEDTLSGTENTAFRMINLDIDFHLDGLNVVVGPTGSGKTSLLMALLGEMTILNGKVQLPGGSREGLVADPATGLTESVAYCAQQAWLVNDTIKQNILFASLYDESSYKSVIEACALTRDLEVLDAGDATIVGEKGIVVSGGQKQRISLARALYCNSRYILLDDCLSAVDSHTAQHVFEQCILGPLMMNRTCILVTHNISLCVPRAQFVVVLANGKVAAQGSAQEVMSSGALGEDLLSSVPPSKAGTHPPSRSCSATDLRDESSANSNNDSSSGKVNGHAKGAVASSKQKHQAGEHEDANIGTEGKAEGAVDWRVIKLYTTSMGGVLIWGGVLATFALENVSQVSMSLWIRRWANSYSTENVDIQGLTMFRMVSASYSAATHWLGLSGHSIPFSASDDILSTTSAVDVDVGYYIGVYMLIGLLFVLNSILNLGVIFKGSLNASGTLHARLLEAVLRAKFKFFDITPLGQIMNRFSKDLQSIDQDVSIVASGMLQGLFSLTATVIVISVITPGFLIVGIFLTGVYFCIAMFYVRSSRDLKRIESVQKAPLFQQFGETLSGITTIRAYGDEQRFIRDNYTRINIHNRPFIYLWATNRWLALRIDWAGAFVSFFAGVFVVANANTIDAGAAGLSLTYALTFNENILWLVRLYADNEQNMNHVERVKNYLELEQEAKALIPENKPPGNWPSRGTVEFINYSTRYRADLEQVLKRLNLKIGAEEKIGIVGRTGAGKSSLAMALFRGLEADEGKILIDDVDIGLIGLQDLRENITIVPQDPTLFTGTIRSNLDPFGLFTDEEVFTSLRCVHLIGDATSSSSSPLPSIEQDTTPASHATTIATSSTTDSDTTNTLSKYLTNSRENTNIFLNLSSPIAESGSNLSQGQRQLLCLARALLKSPRVLLMDEATASIDYATDAKIQDTLRELKGSTVITIAHRLQTIVDYDKVLVLDKGEVIEFDAPWVLIEKEGGIFRGMCGMTGDFEGLIESARKAERKGKLVDL